MLKEIGFVVNYLGHELSGFAYDAIGIYAFPRADRGAGVRRF
jgi:hypothetical protein